MVEDKHKLLAFWKDRFTFRESELDAFRSVRRELFVADSVVHLAYQDTPLPLLRGKTISQPSTVMFMTHALDFSPGERVFEVGTGSAYQAAIIATIVGERGHVYTSEIIPELVPFAQGNLVKAAIDNVTVIEQDGAKGYTEKAPYDKIIITAACKEFPQELLDQLKPGGIIVGPVGSEKEQEMVRGTKDKNGKLALDFLGQFLFTPMYGKHGFLD